MCGIVGEISFRSQTVSEDWIRRACAIMKHRGPDGEGSYQDGPVAFGHRRLAIIDLTDGAQPMSYAGGRYWITYNGEIYNYRELRAELRALGHDFATESDTEVILSGYAAWGLDLLPRLNGIFAFGIWDAQARRLLLARDPLGVKPLLYHADGDGLRFASELKALLAHPAVDAEIDPDGLQDFLALGYALTPRTLVRGIHKLAPGCHLLVEERGGAGTPSAYWDLASAARPPFDVRSERDHAERFDAMLDRTVQMQMVSDVPLGSFLSGGVDSSAISYYACRHAEPTLETFSIGFDEPSFDESEYARSVAKKLGSVHHSRTARAPSPEELERLVWFYDEPLGDTSIIPTYSLASFARERVKVALSGDGADELLAGYDTYVADRMAGFYRYVPGWLHRRVIRPATRFIPSSYRKVALDFKIKQFVEHAWASPERAHFGWRNMLSDEERQAVSGYASPHSPFSAYARHYDAVPDAQPLNRSLYVDLKTWLVDDILAKVDRASMACSLEVRVPYLAPDLVLSLMRLPPEMKLRRLERKYILKKVMRDRLPRSVLRRSKRGFNAPVSTWMRGPLHEYLNGIIEERSSSIIDLASPVVTRLWREHCSGAQDHGHKLWTLFSLVLWERSVLK